MTIINSKGEFIYNCKIEHKFITQLYYVGNSIYMASLTNQYMSCIEFFYTPQILLEIS